MNFLKNFLLTAVLVLVVTATYSQARVQVIHNSADAAAAVVDVWLDQTLLLDNFAFRTASPFVDAPAGTPITIAIKGPDSQNPDDPLWSENYTLTDGEAYVLVAEGIISTSGYDPATPFDVAVFTGAREAANEAGMTDMLSHHGTTDAPTIDIYEIGLATGILLVDNLSYSEFDGYLEILSKDYIFEVRDESGTTPIAAYYASLQELGLKNKAVTLLASGFLNPGNNSNGPAFGLWVAPAEGGDLLELPVYAPTARVQVIHNSADAAAEVVDVWLNETLLIDDFAFRTSTPFVDIPAEQEFTLAIKGPDSQDPEDPIWSGNYTLTVDETYILVAEGIVSPTGYDPPTPFDIAVYPAAREMAIMNDKTDLLVHHGSTDAPTIDIVEVGVGAGLLVDNLSYSEFSGYLELSPLDYIIEIRDETGTVKLAAYEVPLETLGLDSYALTVVASGFLDPGNNNGGPEFGLWFATAAGGNLIKLPAYDPIARVQFIHNSADAAAGLVDIWLDETLLIDNFAFQTSSPFMDIVAGDEFTLAVKGPDSQDPGNPLWSGNYTLAADEAYIFVADGIVSASGYDPMPPFDMEVYPTARENANSGGQTDLLIHHGSTDAPAVDIFEVGIGLGLIADNLDYTEFAGYFGFATVNYIFQVRDETGLVKIAAYEVPLATLGLQGDAVSIIASGFLEPENNGDGPEFGLFLVKATGGSFLKLPVYAPTARLQVIHNSADIAASVADIWLNQDLILDDFAYLTASPFIDVPADEQITISIKGPDSEDPYNPLYFHNYNLTEGETYIFVADGIISGSGYNPPEPFDIAVYPTGREEANISGRTDILVHHGSTDAPVVDVYEIGLGAGLLVDNLAYAEFSSYLELPTIDYILEVRDETGATILGKFRAPLETLGLQDEAITVVATGFVDPAGNSDGEPFGLWAALAAGGPLVELQLYVPSARVQIIHNSADAVASVVDVWLNDDLLLDNFAFRTATPFLYIPSEADITIAVKGPDSQDPTNPLWSESFNLTTDERYIMIANGIISPSGYTPVQPFDMIIYTGAVEDAPVGTSTNVLVFHGVTDAPTVDVAVSDGAIIADNLSYGSFDGYNELPTVNYSLDLTSEDGSSVVGNFLAPLADLGLGGQALTVLASGFLNPGDNSNGPALGLLTVQLDGTAILLTNTIGINESVIDASTFNIFPNPAKDNINIYFELKSKERVSIEMMDISGRMVKSADLGKKDAGNYQERINVEELTSGMYLLNIRTENGSVSKKIFLQ
jgi:hypothetical protein